MRAPPSPCDPRGQITVVRGKDLLFLPLFKWMRRKSKCYVQKEATKRQSGRRLSRWDQTRTQQMTCSLSPLQKQEEAFSCPWPSFLFADGLFRLARCLDKSASYFLPSSLSRDCLFPLPERRRRKELENALSGGFPLVCNEGQDRDPPLIPLLPERTHTFLT